MITIDWATKKIRIPKADTTLVSSSPFEVRELNVNTLRLRLKGLEDDAEGITFLATHIHSTIVTVGGKIFARLVEIINGYTVTFEDGPYVVNLVGANSNIAEVTNLNRVSVRTVNNDGLIQQSGLEPLRFFK